MNIVLQFVMYNHPMPTIKIPTKLRPYTEGERELTVNATTVGKAIAALLARYPHLRDHFYDENGAPRPSMNLVIDEEHINQLQGFDTPLAEGDILRLLISISGG